MRSYGKVVAMSIRKVMPRLFVALLAAFALALAPVVPAYAEGEVGTYEEGSLGFFRWLGDEEVVRLADGTDVNGRLTVRYFRECVDNRASMSSPFNLDCMRESLEILRQFSSRRRDPENLRVDTKLMIAAQLSAAWASHYKTDAEVRKDPHGVFNEFRMEKGWGGSEVLGHNTTDAGDMYEEWFDKQRENYFSGQGTTRDFMEIATVENRYTGVAYCKGVNGGMITYTQLLNTRSRGTLYTLDEFIAKFEEYYDLVMEAEGVGDGSDGSGFSDVSEDAWYAGTVASASELGYLTGYAGTTRFGPEDVLTRAQAAVVLFNMASHGAAGSGDVAPDGSYDADATLETGFADVDGDAGFAWASAEIRWARDMGIVTGTASGFEPGRGISREEFATMLARYAQRTGAYEAVGDPDAVLDGYGDGSAVDDWARDLVAWAVEAGVMGRGTASLNPAAAVVRAEAAAMAVRLQP